MTMNDQSNALAIHIAAEAANGDIELQIKATSGTPDSMEHKAGDDDGDNNDTLNVAPAMDGYVQSNSYSQNVTSNSTITSTVTDTTLEMSTDIVVPQQMPQPDLESIDRRKLFEILKKTQCPLMPKKFKKDGEPKAAYFYANRFWIADEENPSLCHQIQYSYGKADDNNKKYEDAKNKVEVMLAIDDYLSDVRINKSIEIYDKLMTAKAEVSGFDDGNDENDAYKKLIPTMSSRVMFASVLITVALNGYLILNNVKGAYYNRVSYGSTFLAIIAMATAISELILYGNVLFGYVGYAVVQLIHRMCTGNTYHHQTKQIALNLRSLSTLSILRYLPSVELVTSYITRCGETTSKVWVEFWLLYKSFRNVCDIVFAVPTYIVEVIAPFLALFGILIKLRQLSFVNTHVIFETWELAHYLTFVAFLNQVGGLRVIRLIETKSIQHFVFSGADAKLDRDELLLLNDWWDTSLLSSVSNIGLNWYDSMVFWYSLDPLKIQLLLKNHDQSAGSGKSLLETIKENDHLLDAYTNKVNYLYLNFDRIQRKQELKPMKIESA